MNGGPEDRGYGTNGAARGSFVRYQTKDPAMRLLILAALIAPIFLAACGTTEEDRTVVVAPHPGQTVVVAPPDH